MISGFFSKFLLLRTFTFIKKVVPKSLRARGIFTLLAVFLNSILDLLGIASLIPLLMIIIDDNAISNNRYLSIVYHSLNFTSDRAFIVFICLLVLVFILLKNLLSLVLYRAQYNYSFLLHSYFSRKIYGYYYSRGLLFLKNSNSNTLVNHINNSILYFVQFIVVGFLAAINELIVMLLVVVGIFVYDPRSVLILVISMAPILIIFSNLVRKRLNTLGRTINALYVQQNKNAYESFQGYVDIEIKNKASWVFSKFNGLLKKLSQLRVQNLILLQLPLKVFETALVFSLVVFIVISSYLYENLSSISIILGVFGIAAYRVLPSINRLMINVMGIRNYQYTFEVIEHSLHNEATDPLHRSVDEKLVFNDKIVIRDLAFSFDSTPILKSISFDIQKGERVGIVGRSGSGKTTLLNLLLGFYFPRSGSISVDDVELKKENIYRWRKVIGYVPQEVFLMDASLAENIAFGEELDQIDMEKITEVINLSNLGTLVESLPDGVMTNIGERGGKLSGGQKQRIGIARALYKDAEILFLDEATSALDNETEEEINQSIKHLSERSSQFTIVIIAHRITSLKHCTKIIEMDEGKLVQVWTYEELVERQLNREIS